MKKTLLSALLMLAFLVSCTPAATPTPPPPTLVSVDASVSPAAVTVDMFYTFINAAQTADELGMPWNMLTHDAQCNAIEKCELANFQSKWWQSKALYRLYVCDSHTVIAQELKYPREANPPSAMTDAKYWIYDLMQSNGLMLISKIYTTKAPGSECVLAIERIE